MATLFEKSVAIHDIEQPKSSLQAQDFSPSPAWTTITEELSNVPPLQTESHEFWWSTTGSTFAILLEKAGYSFHDQCQHLRFLALTIIPELGAGPGPDGSPKAWKSFMSDHHNPVEFSWEWNSGDELPVIRFSFEPIGPAAGTADDLFNQHAALRFLDTQQHLLAGCDLSLFWHFWNSLVSFDEPSQAPAPAPTHQSRVFLAFEFNVTGVMMKAYIMPHFKARATGRSTMALVHDAVASIPAPSPVTPQAHARLSAFLQSSNGQSLVPEIVAVDCIPPEKARVKIYMRSQATSLSSVIETLTLSDAAEQVRLAPSITELGTLWSNVFGVDPGFQGHLPPVDHRTAGMCFNFDFQADRTAPAGKIYIPIRHYARSDLDAAVGLQRFVRLTGRRDFSGKYLEAVRDIMWSSGQSGGRGLQTYYGVGLKKDSVRLTSYLSPIVFRT